MWSNTKYCGAWLSWGLEAIEMRVMNDPILLEIGVWDEIHGLSTEDDLFPHYTGGLRQRTINVATLEVYTPFFVFFNQIRVIYHLFLYVTVPSVANL